jgi:hypothetical protein
MKPVATLALGVLAGTIAALAGTAAAGTVSGRITEAAGGAGIASAEVRIWVLGTKGYSITQTVAANASGDYAFTVGAGTYKVDARGPGGSGINYGDRWYDAAAPSSGGYVGDNADALAVTATSATGSIDIALEILGGADGTVLHSGSTPAPSMWVRMERRGEVRIHHNDFSDAPTGLASMRGMVPAGDYQIITYDPTGVRDTLLTAGPFSITSNTNGSFGNLAMGNAPADPNEGNNTANCGASSINAAALHMDPPQSWSSAGARIGPLANADVDWYCFTAVDGDRLFLTATTEFTFNGATRRHPWTDPLLSFWRGARVTRLVENDDYLGTLDARVDTGPLTAGCHCAAVTTFGDANYVGAGQNSTGPYQLRVVMGNRPPVPSIKKGATEVPAAPATFTIDEGDTLTLDLSYRDADHDVPTKAFTHTDNTATAVAGGTLALNAETGTYTWVAGPTAAAGSPYTLRLTAGDTEFPSQSKTVTLVVRDVNMPPEVPVPVSPINNAVVMTGAPALVWSNAADPETNPVTYDVELYADDTGGAPAQSITGVAETATTTMWTPATIAENTRVFWRVRARDNLGGLSPWSDYAAFLVDSANDAPEQPILLKPADAETIAMRRPGLSVLNVEDPEDDAIEFFFEIASDSNFTMIAWSSPGVAQNVVSGTTMASTGVDLLWGGEYFARVKARDARGGESTWSDTHRFRLKQNVPPGDPAWDGACVATTYDMAPPTEIVVRNVIDLESEPITFELQVFRFDDDPGNSFPVYQTTAMMSTSGATTAIPVDLSELENGRYRYFVRAFDGTDASNAIECELTLDVVPPGDPSGGCCDSGHAPIGTSFIVLMFILGRRRRVRC